MSEEMTEVQKHQQNIESGQYQFDYTKPKDTLPWYRDVFNWLVILLAFAFLYLLWAIQNGNPEVVIENHKEMILEWVREDVFNTKEAALFRKFSQAELKPNQTMTFYYQRNGDGTEVVEFKPQRTEEIKRLLRAK